MKQKIYTADCDTYVIDPKEKKPMTARASFVRPTPFIGFFVVSLSFFLCFRKMNLIFSLPADRFMETQANLM